MKNVKYFRENELNPSLFERESGINMDRHSAAREGRRGFGQSAVTAYDTSGHRRPAFPTTARPNPSKAYVYLTWMCSWWRISLVDSTMESEQWIESHQLQRTTSSAMVGPISFGFVMLVLLYWKWTRSRTVRLVNALPGPKPLPFLGNVLDLNVDHDGIFRSNFCF